jgi:osmoprotectant transport system permease protein
MAEAIRWDWLERHTDDIIRASIEHVQIVGIAMAISIAIAIPVAIAVRGRRLPFAAASSTADILYTVPSLAMFAFFVPIVGIGDTAAIIGLVAYAMTALIRNTVVGLESVPGPVLEAARGMGLTRRQTLVRVELPLALPAIVTGVRLATVSTVGIATIAIFVGGGGLGELILKDGIQRDLFLTPILAGTVCATAIAIALDMILLGAERAITPWARARVAR